MQLRPEMGSCATEKEVIDGILITEAKFLFSKIRLTV
jgi:hypothetical protein